MESEEKGETQRLSAHEMGIKMEKKSDEKKRRKNRRKRIRKEDLDDEETKIRGSGTAGGRWAWRDWKKTEERSEKKGKEKRREKDEATQRRRQRSGPGWLLAGGVTGDENGNENEKK